MWTVSNHTLRCYQMYVCHYFKLRKNRTLLWTNCTSSLLMMPVCACWNLAVKPTAICLFLLTVARGDMCAKIQPLIKEILKKSGPHLEGNPLIFLKPLCVTLKSPKISTDVMWNRWLLVMPRVFNDFYFLSSWVNALMSKWRCPY